MRKDVARILRAARDKMNNKGRHWLKGDMSATYDPEDPDSSLTFSPHAEPGDECFCAWGGIEAVTERGPKGDDRFKIPAMEALVKVINPKAYKEYEKELRGGYDFYVMDMEDQGEPALSFEKWRMDSNASYYYDDDWAVDFLGDAIARWNDDSRRKWKDVKEAFTEAARSLR